MQQICNALGKSEGENAAKGFFSLEGTFGGEGKFVTECAMAAEGR